MCRLSEVPLRFNRPQKEKDYEKNNARSYTATSATRITTLWLCPKPLGLAREALPPPP